MKLLQIKSNTNVRIKTSKNVNISKDQKDFSWTRHRGREDSQSQQPMFLQEAV